MINVSYYHFLKVYYQAKFIVYQDIFIFLSYSIHKFHILNENMTRQTSIDKIMIFKF